MTKSFRRIADMTREASIRAVAAVVASLLRARRHRTARCLWRVATRLILSRSPAQIARMERKRGLL